MAEAAKLTGYNQDYLGQLARSGKLKAKKIGRNWITTLEAINKINGEITTWIKKQEPDPELSELSDVSGGGEKEIQLKTESESALREYAPSVPLNVYKPESTLTSGSSPFQGEERPPPSAWAR